jgi:hypothetical protein
MTNENRVTLSFECSDWLAKQVDLICDHKTAAYPQGGRVTRDEVLQGFVLDAVMARMQATPAGTLKLKRPPPASARKADALGFLD